MNAAPDEARGAQKSSREHSVKQQSYLDQNSPHSFIMSSVEHSNCRPLWKLTV